MSRVAELRAKFESAVQWAKDNGWTLQRETTVDVCEKSCCILGACVLQSGVEIKPGYSSVGSWIDQAEKLLGITEHEAFAIVNGFDDAVINAFDRRYYEAAREMQDLGNEFGKLTTQE